MCHFRTCHGKDFSFIKFVPDARLPFHPELSLNGPMSFLVGHCWIM